MGSKCVWYTPNQVLQQSIQSCKTLYKSKWEPIAHPKEQDATYFNNPRTFEKQLQYDLYFAYSRVQPLFDQRKERENRPCLRDIRENVFKQESKKAVPALTSLMYGRGKTLESTERKNNHVDQISSFYRRNGAFPVIEKEVSSNSKNV